MEELDVSAVSEPREEEEAGGGKRGKRCVSVGRLASQGESR